MFRVCHTSMRIGSFKSTKACGSPFVKELAPSSKRIQQLMDDQENAYVQVIAPEPESRGPAPRLHRSHIVRDRYFAAAAATMSKSTHNPPKSNQRRRDSFKRGAESSASLTPPRPSSAVAKPSKQSSFEHHRLYHFYNRQVFALGGEASDQPGSNASLQYQLSSATDGNVDGARDDSNSDGDDVFDTASADDDGFDERVLDSNPPTDDLYDHIFQVDWAASHIEKVVKDGVECRRIYAAIKPHYRILVGLFRQFATCAPTATVRLAPSYDQPIPRHSFVSFLVHVAQGYLKREELVGMLKRLAREGLDASAAFHHLLHDNILPYAAIQDGAHFRRLFHDHAAIQCLHFKYIQATTKVFQAHATLATSDPLSSSGARDPPSNVRFLKLTGFLAILSQLHQMDAKLDDAKATQIFVSCLPVWPDEFATAAQELTFGGFQEALTKVLLLPSLTHIRNAPLLAQAKASAAPKFEVPEVDVNPFKLAAVGNLQILKTLVDPTGNKDGEYQGKPIDVNAKDIYGCTPMIWAARNGYFDVFEFLVAHGADIETASFGGMTALHHAVNHCRLNVVTKLIELGASIDTKDDSGNTPLHLGAGRGILNPVLSLLAAGANINETNSQGVTPLHKAVSAGHFPCVEKLLENRADPNAANAEGNTSLHLAAKGGFDNIVHALIDAKANITLKNKAGKTAKDIALTPEIAKRL
ncbi:hypothetical protein DYB32_001448 [Aphanomyces invadans]|uniref:Uncharacterized protein n=1 Tax=Aphanomyces invadans TaxID=157072 RepID=A0A418B6D6_9STRA|nr:hypothetical protein DYB32_001448 [Aphanomyces invadans]